MKKFYQNVFCFFKIWLWIGQYNPFPTIIDKFYFVFKEFCCPLGLVSTKLKCVMDAFFKNEYTASIKKMEGWPRDTQKVIFLLYSWVENILSPNIWDCPLNPTLNYCCLRWPCGSKVSRRLRRHIHKEDVLVRIRSNYLSFFIFYDF